MLMVFADPADRNRVAALAEEVGGLVLEWYEGYAVAEVPDDAARRRLQDAYPVEDVTSRYGIRGSDRQLDTFRPRIDREGKLNSHPDYAYEPSLPEGPHHYLVQFLGPIKQEWLDGVVDAGGQLREPHRPFTYVVQADSAAVERIARMDCVRWLGARLDGAILWSANLAGADLRGANLSGATLVQADLAGARADGATVWPDGFDWRSARVVVDGR